MHSLSAGVTQSWFVAKAAVALVPIVIFGAADVIGWFLRRTIWRRKTMVPRSERARDERAGCCSTEMRRADVLLTASMPDSRVSVGRR